jgi:alkyl sulfatase BDS1-like metallo-beta-lactamase superfamily hydrolase
MTAWITQDWLDKHLDLADALPERPGATATIRFEVAGAGTVSFTTTLTDGRMVANELDVDDEADFTLKFTEADFVAVIDGDLDLQAGYMQGRVKAAGNVGRLLSILPVTTSAEWCGVYQRLADAT